MSDYRAVSKRPSWGSIILFMFIFFPIGIYLLIKRNTTPKYSDVNMRNQYHSSPHENYDSTNNDTSIKKGASWGVIISLLFLFFPVGIPMLIKKVTSEKYRYDQNGRTMKVLGWILIGFGFIYLLSGFSGDVLVEDGESLFGTVLLGLFIFVGSGSLLVYQGSKLRRRAYRINRYTSIISNRKEYSLRNIAAAYPADYESTCRDLQFMIDSGFLPDSYLDLQRDELVMAKSKKTSVVNHEGRVSSKSGTSSIIIKCPGCGALNKIIQEGAYECEYCGSFLQ